MLFLIWLLIVKLSLAAVPEYGQCGGQNYNGPTDCVAGTQCFIQTIYYSQCLRSCPSGWVCECVVTINPGVLPTTFPGCQFRYGRDWVGEGSDYSSYDYITMWAGSINSECPGSNSKNPSCTDFNPYWIGAMCQKAKSLNKVAVFYGYIIAFEARNLEGLQDCDMGYPNLCEHGAQFIRNNRARILERYEHYSYNIAKILGSNYPTVFLIEPDFWQYYGNSGQTDGPLTGSQMRLLFDDIVKSIKKNLPNAMISWDISAWIGQQAMTQWWSYFKDSSQISFIHTSGGQSHGELSQIKPNELSWSFLSQLTGKRLIADSGYGVGGGGSNNRDPWYLQSNVDNRISDGVISVSLANSNRVPTYKPKLC